MKAKELREKTDSELREMEREHTRDLWKTRLDNFTNQLDDTAKIGRLRREIARIKTLRAQRAKEPTDV
jgi:large subunit ribosomal protein L29